MVAAADVAGLLVPGVAVTVPTATLRTLAAAFAAPLPLLVDVLAGATGILLPGAVVSGPWTYSIAAGDTLAAVATRFGRAAPELGAALGTVTGLLAPGVEIRPSRGGSYTTRAGDTIAGIAAALDTTVGSLAADAAQVPGLLVPGVPIALPPYTVATADTLTAVAGHFPVTVADLGAALADSPGVLEQGAAVNLVVRTSTVGAQDTLFSVLDYLALDVATPGSLSAAVANLAAMNADAPGLLAPGSVLAVPEPVVLDEGDTIAGLAAAHQQTPLEVAMSIAARTDVLRADVTVSVPDPADPEAPPRVVTTGNADSLDRIAAVTMLGLEAVSAAVKDRQDLLLPGVVIALTDPETPPDTVGPHDTLDAVATRIGHGVTPSWLVSTLLHDAAILAPGATVRYLSRVPGFSLSKATVTLADSNAHPTESTALTFLLHTASNIEFDNLGLNLDFQVNQLEYDIANVPWAQGYQSSDWLTFLRPPTDNHVGQIDVPIALRAFPVPPSVTGQRITPAAARTTVRDLDTLHTVAGAIGIPAAAAADTLLAPGAVLQLPTTDRHRTRSGETATDLAGRVGAPPALVAAAVLRHSAAGPATATSEAAADAELPEGTIVPVPRLHTVDGGESLAAVAGRHGVPVDHLFALNAHTPALLQIGATISATASPTLQDLRRYDYDYTFTVKRAAQDTISTGYAQNTPPGSAAPVVAAPADPGGGLGASLAQFATIRELLALDLAQIPSVDPLLPATANPGVAAALPVLAQLATQIAADWVGWAAPPADPVVPDRSSPGSAPRHEPAFELRRGTSPTGGTTVQLLSRGPVADILVAEPQVRLSGRLAADGHTRAGVAPVSFARAAAPLAVPPGPATQAPGPGTATETLPGVDEFTLAIPGRDVISTQNIWGRVSLTRNTNLLAGVPTGSAFVYTVPDARMPAPAMPLISATDAFDLTGVPFEPAGAPPNSGPDGLGRRQLDEWLINFFDSLINRYAVLGDDTLPIIAARHALGLTELTPAICRHPRAGPCRYPAGAAGRDVHHRRHGHAAADRHRAVGPAHRRGGRRRRPRRRAHPRDVAAARSQLAVPEGRHRLRVLGGDARHAGPDGAERDRLPAPHPPSADVPLRLGDGPRPGHRVLRHGGPAAEHVGRHPRRTGRRRDVGSRRQPLHDPPRRLGTDRGRPFGRDDVDSGHRTAAVAADQRPAAARPDLDVPTCRTGRTTDDGGHAMTEGPPRLRAPVRRRRARALFVLGVALIVVAAALAILLRATVVTYPDDAFRDTTVQATGTATLLVDPATLLPVAAPGRTLPLDLQRRVHTVGTAGGTVIVEEDDALSIAGLPPQRFVQRFTVDGNTARNLATPQAYAYTPDNVVDRSPAYSVAFPFSAGTGTYPVWSDETGQPVTYTYVEKTTVDGLGVNRYHGVLDSTDLTPALLARLTQEGLPSTMTFDQLKPQLAADGVNIDGFVNVALRQLEQPDQQAVNALLAAPVPLAYQLSADSQLLVEPRTGAIVSGDRVDKTITERPEFSGIGRIYAIITQDKYATKPAVTAAAADLARLIGAPPTTKLLTESYSQTPPSVTATAAAAKSWANRIILLTITVPIVVGVLGLLVIVAAWWTQGRERRRSRESVTEPAPDDT